MTSAQPDCPLEVRCFYLSAFYLLFIITSAKSFPLLCRKGLMPILITIINLFCLIFCLSGKRFDQVLGSQRPGSDQLWRLSPWNLGHQQWWWVIHCLPSWVYISVSKPLSLFSPSYSWPGVHLLWTYCGCCLRLWGLHAFNLRNLLTKNILPREVESML